MQRIFDMAIKDLKILFRDKLGAFFIIGFPIMMGLFFGSMMGGIGGNSGDSTNKVPLAIVDLDQSEMSKKFVASLGENKSLDLKPGELEASKEQVRKGNYVGVLVLDEGFGAAVGVFWGDPPELKLGMDPSRGAESAMVQGYVMQAVGAMMGERMSNPDSFRSVIDDAKKDVSESEDMNIVNRQLTLGMLGTVESMINSVEALQNNATEEGGGDSDAGVGGSFEFAKITELDITRAVDPNDAEIKSSAPRTGWDISFPQAMLWGVLGCIAGFAASIARERAQGTMMRLQVAPVSKFDVLAGKGLACFIAVIFVIAMMTVLGVCLGMRPGSYLNLVIAALSVGFCFVGVMMLLSTVGETEQSVSSIVWIGNMVMAMIGGCMIPVMFMPGFIRQLSVLSPVRWAIAAIEGAIWRNFSLAEMLPSCAILIAVGTVGIVLGSFILKRKLG